MDDGVRAAQQYDAMAQEYSDDNYDGVWNSLYERPAMLSMLGDVHGRRVLDLGCGAGQLSLDLLGSGAAVTGIDVSPSMVQIARSRLGDQATFATGDLNDSLPFETGEFDVAVASLVMHYIEDWVPLLQEIRRVLASGGSFTFSTHHPTMDWKLHSPEDYFAKKQLTDSWTKRGVSFDVTYWRRSMAEMG